MSFVGYLLRHPVKAFRTFWRAYTGTEKLADLIKDEETRMNALRAAIGFYYMSFGRFPETLKDLCHNNHGDPGWEGPFIRWDGEGTFVDTFGFPYRYAVADGEYHLVGPGLETAKREQSIADKASR